MRNTAAKPERKFLAGVPVEIREVLDWYDAGHARVDAPTRVTEFATKFLGAMNEIARLFQRWRFLRQSFSR